MQLLYTVFFLGVLGTSALRNCDTYCKDKGKCATVMASKKLVCASNAQQRKECDHHHLKSDLSHAEIKKECCHITCYSLFTNKKFTCPVGHIAPTKEERRHVHSPDRKSEELQRECCRKPRVTCYTMLKDNKFTCPSTHIKPNKHYLNDDIHEDMSKKTTKELQTKCCPNPSVCFQKLTSKKLNCDGFGMMISPDDMSRDKKLTKEADTNDSTLQKQCCRPNCFSIMAEKGLSCKDKIMRGKQDGHRPNDTSEQGIVKECCQQNCYSKMTADKLTCPKGSVLKDKRDMHNPGGATGEDLKKQCCQKVHCQNNYCFSAMSEKGIWGSCPKNTMSPSVCDGHYPFGWRHGQTDQQRMATIKSKSAEEIRKGCCRQACYGTMKSKNLKCPTGYKGRGESDGHNPFGDDDWNKKPDKEIKSQCCRKVNKCYTKLRENNLDCSGYGHMIDEFSNWHADVDTSKLKTDEEIQSGCCQKTCSLVMTKKKLECNNSEELRCESHYRPHGWKSFDQPEADLKWACCQVESGPKRKKFDGCKALLKCSGDDCNSKCPGDERIRDHDEDDPFRGSRDFTKMKEADLKKHCCRPSCYDQVNRRKLKCPVGTKMFDKYDSHNPFGWDKDMRAQSDTGIMDKCCKPLNKCYVKLKQMKLDCNGIGSFPGDTDKANYDFDPQKLTDANDVKSKCCQMNCFYSMKKRSLKCKAGSPRSKYDGHKPFGSSGFSKQSDAKILEECCSENCFSYFKANDKLTCDSGDVRDERDFHHVNFKNLKKPEDAKAECCRQDCSAALKSKGFSCGSGYKLKDEQRSVKEWNEYDENRMKGECCEKLSEECNTAIAKTKKRAKWLDKRPKSAAGLVTYLNNWGDKVLKTKTTTMLFQVHSCKRNNKQFKTEEACKDKGCCFVCDKIDCRGDMPIVSTCADNEPSAFMKKFGSKECSTSSSVDFKPANECGLCPSPRDLFEQYDDGKLSMFTFNDGSTGIGSTKSGFYGGTNLHNVRSEVRINDKVCPQPTAGLLISPHNSGTFAMTGKPGTVFAIVGVVNEKSTGTAKGVKLGGGADYLVIGGENRGDVDFTTTGKVSVVGVDNKGKVSASAAEDILVGNTVNSGKVVLLSGKSGAIVNVANKAGAEVTVTKGGTWTLHDVSNAKGAKVTVDASVINIGGSGTRNDGIVEVKRGKIVAMAKANTGTIIFADGVTGTLLLCKNDGKIENNGKVKVTIKADDPFCSRAVAKPTKKPASLAPEQFYCGNSAKYSNNVIQFGDSKQRCGALVDGIKDVWTVFRREVGNPEFELFFDKCCAPTTSGTATAAKASTTNKPTTTADTTTAAKASTTKNPATTAGTTTAAKASTTKNPATTAGTTTSAKASTTKKHKMTQPCEDEKRFTPDKVLSRECKGDHGLLSKEKCHSHGCEFDDGRYAKYKDKPPQGWWWCRCTEESACKAAGGESKVQMTCKSSLKLGDHFGIGFHTCDSLHKDAGKKSFFLTFGSHCCGGSPIKCGLKPVITQPCKDEKHYTPDKPISRECKGATRLSKKKCESHGCTFDDDKYAKAVKEGKTNEEDWCRCSTESSCKGAGGTWHIYTCKIYTDDFSGKTCDSLDDKKKEHLSRWGTMCCGPTKPRVNPIQCGLKPDAGHLARECMQQCPMEDLQSPAHGFTSDKAKDLAYVKANKPWANFLACLCKLCADITLPQADKWPAKKEVCAQAATSSDWSPSGAGSKATTSGITTAAKALTTNKPITKPGSGKPASGPASGLRIRSPNACIELGDDVKIKRVGDAKLDLDADVHIKGALDAKKLYVGGVSLEDLVRKLVAEALKNQ